jgi:hypothetical protein
MDGLSGEVDTVAREFSRNIHPLLHPWNRTAAYSSISNFRGKRISSLVAARWLVSFICTFPNSGNSSFSG